MFTFLMAVAGVVSFGLAIFFASREPISKSEQPALTGAAQCTQPARDLCRSAEPAKSKSCRGTAACCCRQKPANSVTGQSAFASPSRVAVSVALATLAAAYAETGDFEQAVKWTTQATELAACSSKEEYKARRDLYQSGKPYRQLPAVSYP